MIKLFKKLFEKHCKICGNISTTKICPNCYKLNYNTCSCCNNVIHINNLFNQNLCGACLNEQKD